MSWYNPLDWYTGVDAEIERGKKIDQQIAEFNQQEVTRGNWSSQDLDTFEKQNEYAGEFYRDQVHDAAWDGAAEGWDRIVTPLENAVASGKSVIKTFMFAQWLLVALALYLAYRYFLGGGSVKKALL